MSKLWRWPKNTEETNKIENIDPIVSLESLRTEIDDIDAELTALLVRRFALTEKIGKAKSRLGCKVKDEAREAKVLERVSGNLAGRNSRDFILSIFKSLFKESVEHQQATMAESEKRIEDCA